VYGHICAMYIVKLALSTYG